METCVGQKVDRARPEGARYAARPVETGPQRACWNSAAAPHNLEGFYLNVGDMLVKSGDWQTARKIYANAKLSDDYASWPFAAELEERIAHAQDNVAAFNGPDAAHGRPGVKMMGASTAACMACHQAR